MDKGGRVRLIFATCESAEPFSSHDDAFDGINAIINAIEDVHSSEMYNPQGPRHDRIYGPSRMFAQVGDFPGVIVYAHVAHFTIIHESGAFMFVARVGKKVLVDKLAADGRRCPR